MSRSESKQNVSVNYVIHLIHQALLLLLAIQNCSSLALITTRDLVAGAR